MNKYNELFRLSKYVLDEEVQRFIRIDQKASRYLSVLTVMFGISGFIGKWSIENFILKSDIDYLGMIAFLLFAIFLVLSWYFSFKVLKVHELTRMPMNDEMIAFFDKNNLIDVYYALTKRFKDAYQENKHKTNKKASYLTWSYRFIICTFISLLLTFCLIGIKIYNTRAIDCEDINYKKEVILWEMNKEVIIKGDKTQVILKMIQEN